MMFIAMVATMVGALNNSLYAEEFGTANFLDEPAVALIKALTLQFPPTLHILPLYIVLLAVLPFVLVGFRSWPKLIFCLVCALVSGPVRQTDRAAGLSWTRRIWAFNPLAWQAQFLLRACLGSRHPWIFLAQA
jgi:hypothetical protein